MTNTDQFSTIINSIDTNIKIIIDNNTGYYNITKINNYIYEQQNEASGNSRKPSGIPLGRKLIKNWYANKSNQELIKELKKQLNIDDDLILIINDVIDEYKGTYVHKYLFEHILMWIDKSYAIKISIILNQNHIDYNNELKYKNKELNKENKSLSDKVDNLIEQNNEILQHARDLKKQNKKLSTQLTNVQDTLDDVVEDVVIKTSNIGKLHMCTIFKCHTNDDEIKTFKFIRTQKVSHNTRINSILKDIYEQEDGEDMTKYKKRLKKLRSNHILHQVVYNGNSINLYNRLKEIMYEVFEDIFLRNE